jgi:7-cyano-7-deazaguanine reductase
MDLPLGKPTAVPDHYDPTLLAPMERGPARETMGISGALPFVGEDVWNGYEFSWLGPNGLPRAAGLRLRIGADSPRIVESKSMKLYLNGFAQTRFESADAATGLLSSDLEAAFSAPVSVEVLALDELATNLGVLPGESLDSLDVAVDVYERAPGLLAPAAAGGESVEETLHTHLFRSLCPVTAQPDWASVLVRYRGPAIDRGSLLRYLVSFRRHQAFHETTIEQIFLDLKERCRCEKLVVGGYFLRRGGLDINPFRADPGEHWPVIRLARQ